ncbi:hypothetical protein [Photorhabdus australis]|uniref:hypothetical protein n=1 Tax=Photorhabdus australis TaxID=286156 RepID=UPI0030DDD5FF
MLPGIRSLAAAMHLEIYWVYAPGDSLPAVAMHLEIHRVYIPYLSILTFCGSSPTAINSSNKTKS